MTSPRAIATSLFAAATLIGLTACGTSSKTPSNPSTDLSVTPLTSAPTAPTSAVTTPMNTPTPSATATPTLLNFPGDGLNVTVKNVYNPSVAAGITPAFRGFLAKQLNTLWQRGGSIAGCESSALIVLTVYSSVGYAAASDEGMFGGACSRGGSGALYAQVKGSWQELAGSQGSYDCAELHRYTVPASIAGNTCTDSSGNSQAYSG